MKNLKGAWKKLRLGERVSDEELDGMVEQVEAALPYLTQSQDSALEDTLRTLIALKGYQVSRLNAALAVKLKKKASDDPGSLKSIMRPYLMS
jgi:hypothetical protein